MIRPLKRKHGAELHVRADQPQQKRQRNGNEADNFQAGELEFFIPLRIDDLCDAMSWLVIRKKPCYFFRLPAELRNRIYRMVLPDQQWMVPV